MSARVPELVALVLHIMPAHPPFEHGAGDAGHIGADGHKDLAAGQFREAVFQREIARIEKLIGIAHRKAQRPSLAPVLHGLCDLRLQGTHHGIPKGGVPLAVEVARAHAQIMIGFH